MKTIQALAHIMNRIKEDYGISTCVEIGCGDFNVAQMYAGLFEEYTGIDIVDSIIKENHRRYGSESIHFAQMDAVTDVLPDAELLVIRQVLQHLNNAEIKRIISKFGNYNYILIGETQYKKQLAENCNKDIDRSRNTRRNKKSGVYLEEPPFSLNTQIMNVTEYSETVDFVVYFIDSSMLR